MHRTLIFSGRRHVVQFARQVPGKHSRAKRANPHRDVFTVELTNFTTALLALLGSLNIRISQVRRLAALPSLCILTHDRLAAS